MLQTSVAIMRDIEHEDIAAVWRYTPEVDFCLTDLLGITQQALAVKGCRGTSNHEAVRHSACGEAAAPEVAHLYGAVHQLVVVSCGVGAKALCIDLHSAQAGGQLPVRHLGRWADAQLVGLCLLAMHAQQQAGAVEKTTALVQPGGTHGSVVGIDQIAQLHRRICAAVQLPLVLAQLLHGNGLAVLAGVQILQVLGKFTHQIAAGNPDGQ